MLSGMEKYKIHEVPPGKQWMDELVEGLKIKILKVLSKKEVPRLRPNGFPSRATALNEEYRKCK